MKKKPEELFAEQFKYLFSDTDYVLLPQYKFLKDRRFKIDFVIKDQRSYNLVLAIEIMGGTWVGGRHVTGVGYERDCEKLNLMTLEGYHVMYFTSKMVEDGRAIEFVKRYFGL